ncbi:glycerophosphodiester phosphodiesterase family protein [Paenibacillus sp. MSJ-34]|uniref:glycerophosphodiester phosphodiesterase family protein n=1 Tax=Paenibacillus sp. MSJ-34 TaxID=2841529 RepID=UPI001C10E9EB|nr:glycerophosphodiester phosphodiesterase family protein [Paenibacillus sp. MSJ-34]MBU5443706.1 lamin tail domain-containing protein [Paenibacillus sp. MSJ-34]
MNNRLRQVCKPIVFALMMSMISGLLGFDRFAVIPAAHAEEVQSGQEAAESAAETGSGSDSESGSESESEADNETDNGTAQEEWKEQLGETDTPDEDRYRFVSVTETAYGPELFVTELHPNNKGTDDYEFFEIYNNSDVPLRIGAESALLGEAEYYIMYRYPSAGTSDNTFEHFTPVTIEPQTAHVFWVNPKAKTLAEFNELHGVELSSEQVTEVRINGTEGFSNTADRAVAVFNKKTGLAVSQASYAAGSDIADGLGVHYQVPRNGDIHQLKYWTKAPATPGEVFPWQIPPQAVTPPEENGPADPLPKVLISQFMYDAPSADDGKEYIVIKNYEDMPVDIGGYMIGDGVNQGSGEGMAAFPPGTTIEPGQEIVIAQSGKLFKQTYGVIPDFEFPWIGAYRPEDDPDVPDMMATDWSKGVVQLGNSGDKILLMDREYHAIDFITYKVDRVFRGIFYKAITAIADGNGNAIHRVSMTGDPSADFAAKKPSLPDRPLPVPVSDTLLITEVMYTPNYDEPLYEYVEMTNISDRTMDISGYYLGDKEIEGSSSSEGMFNFPDGTWIEPYQALVIAKNAKGFEELYGRKADFELDGSDPSVPDMIPNCDWGCGNMQFGNNGDEVLLLDADKNLIDAVVYKAGKYLGIKPHAGVMLKGFSLERVNARDTKSSAADFTEQPNPTPGMLLFGPNGRPDLIPEPGLKDSVLKASEPATALVAGPTLIDAGSELSNPLPQNVPSFLLTVSMDEGGTLFARNRNTELSAALDFLDNKAIPVLELDDNRLIQPVHDLLERRNATDVIIVSPDWNIVRKMRALQPEYRGAVRFDNRELNREQLKQIVLSVRRSTGMIALIDHRALTQESMQYLRNRAITVWGYGSGTEFDAHRLIALGAAGIEALHSSDAVQALRQYDAENSISQSPLIVAHRGLNALAPENTIPAFELAVEAGIELIELDIHLTKDGKLVIMHDFSVDRTTDGSGKVRDLTLEQLKLLQANKTDNADWQEAYDRYPDAKVPTLDEVLEFAKGKNVVLELELKGIGIEEQVVEHILRHDMAADVYVTSFSLDLLKKVAELSPDIGLTLITSDRGPTEQETMMQYVEKMAAMHVSLGMSQMSGVNSQEWINYAKHRGIPLIASTYNTKSSINQMVRKGATTILTDYAHWMKEVPVAVQPVAEQYRIAVGESVTPQTFAAGVTTRTGTSIPVSGGIRVIGSDDGVVAVQNDQTASALKPGTAMLQIYYDFRPFQTPVDGDPALLDDVWRIYSNPIALTVTDKDAPPEPPTPAPIILSLGLTPGTGNSTTRVTGLQSGSSYRYFKGSAGSRTRPNAGDEPSAYKDSLTGATNIRAAAGDRLFIVRLDANGKIAEWADLAVEARHLRRDASPGTPSPSTSSSGRTPDSPPPEQPKPPVEEQEPELNSSQGVSKLDPAKLREAKRMIEQFAQASQAELTPLAEPFRFEPPGQGGLTVKIEADALPQGIPVGLYQIRSDGKLAYVGGVLAGHTLTAELKEAGTYAVLAYNKTFADVRSDHWAFAAVRQLSAMQVVAGRNAAEFAPNGAVTRAELTAMLVRAIGLQAEGSPSFSDVPAEAWYAGAVAVAEQAGIASGYGDGTFAPDEFVTREQMAALLVKAYVRISKDATGSGEPIPYLDLDQTSAWALDYIIAAHALGLLHGRDREQFVPLAHSTRAEAAQAIYNLLGTRERAAIIDQHD